MRCGDRHEHELPTVDERRRHAQVDGFHIRRVRHFRLDELLAPVAAVAQNDGHGSSTDAENDDVRDGDGTQSKVQQNVYALSRLGWAVSQSCVTLVAHVDPLG